MAKHEHNDLDELLKEAAQAHEPTPGLAGRIAANADAQPNPRPDWFGWLRLHPMAGAASALLPLMIGYLAGVYLPQNTTVQDTESWSSVSLLAFEKLSLDGDLDDE